MPIYNEDRKIVTWTLIDEADAEAVLWYRWRLSPQGYAVAGAKHPGPMHRLILKDELRSGLVGDHINRDKLDNRRENLRAVTPMRNGQNAGGRSTWRGRPASSIHRGVSLRPEKGNKWLAQARYYGKQRYLGLHDDELDAARAVQEFWRDKGIEYHLPDVGESADRA